MNRPAFLLCDDGVGCIFASLLKPSRFPLIASNASSRLFSPVLSKHQRHKMRSNERHPERRTYRCWRVKAHLRLDAAEQPQLLFLLLKHPSLPVFLQHFLLLLQTFSGGPGKVNQHDRSIGDTIKMLQLDSAKHHCLFKV